MSNTISLCPQSDLSGFGECCIADLNDACPVEGHFDNIAFDLERQRMPSPARHFEVLAGHLPTDAIDDLVKSDVVFECIRPRNIIIEGVPHGHNDSTCLVHAAFDGFE